MKKSYAIFLIVIGAVVSWQGVVEFDAAKTTIHLIRGFFWLTMGVLCFSNGLRKYKNE